MSGQPEGEAAEPAFRGEIELALASWHCQGAASRARGPRSNLRRTEIADIMIGGSFGVMVSLV